MKVLLWKTEQSKVKDSNLLLYLDAKFLAINEPIEKPTKCIFSNFSSSIKFNNCNEKFEYIKTKTLVMTGENDIGSTPEMSKNLSKKIANSKVKIVSNGKHLCSIECADDVNNAIQEHIKND